MWSATLRAAARSGDPASPTAKECSCGHQASSRPPLSTRRSANFLATAEMIDESRPPDNSTPYGTSDISCRFTASSSAVRSAAMSAGFSFTASYSNQSRWYQRIIRPSFDDQ